MSAVDWGALLDRKYSNLEAQTAADTTRANAYGMVSNSEANLNNLKAGWVGKQAVADIAESTARTRQINTNADLAPGIAKATEASAYGSAYRDRGEGALGYANATGAAGQNDLLGKAIGGDPQALALIRYFRFGMPDQAPQQSQVNGYGFSSGIPSYQQATGLQ